MIQLGNIQRDGRRYVTEIHTLPSGDVKTIEYFAAIGTDYQAVYDARHEQLLQPQEEIIVLPDLEQTARDVAVNAFSRPIETMHAILQQAPIDNVVGLFNADGVERIAKVEGE